MMTKKYVLIFSVFVALALVVGSSGSALAATFTTDTTYCVGNECSFTPAGGDVTTLVGNDITISRVSASYPFFAQSPLMLNWNGDGFMPMTYVFFELQGWEWRAYENGSLDILVQNPNSGLWEVCPSFGVLNASGELGGRIACVAPYPNTIYGKGTLDRSDLPFQYAGAP